MDVRDARRAAEKAARDLLNARTRVVGDLAVATAARAKATDAAARAGDQGRALVEAAKREAASITEAAAIVVADADAGYAAAHRAATAAGWQPAELTALGFPAPTRFGRKEARPRTSPTTPASDGTGTPTSSTNGSVAEQADTTSPAA